MIDEKKLHQASMRGKKAKALLEDELIRSALDDIREIVYGKIAASAFDEKEAREDCYRMLRAAEMFEGMLKRHINTGLAAEERLSTMQRVVKRIQEF